MQNVSLINLGFVMGGLHQSVSGLNFCGRALVQTQMLHKATGGVTSCNLHKSNQCGPMWDPQTQGGDIYIAR